MRRASSALGSPIRSNNPAPAREPRRSIPHERLPKLPRSAARRFPRSAWPPLAHALNFGPARQARSEAKSDVPRARPREARPLGRSSLPRSLLRRARRDPGRDRLQHGPHRLSGSHLRPVVHGASRRLHRPDPRDLRLRARARRRVGRSQRGRGHLPRGQQGRLEPALADDALGEYLASKNKSRDRRDRHARSRAAPARGRRQERLSSRPRTSTTRA